MSDFLLYSIIGSVALTVLVNLLPRVFPRLGRKTERAVQSHLEAVERGEEPRVKVFFPWKTMLVVSVVLTLLVNAVAYFAA